MRVEKALSIAARTWGAYFCHKHNIADDYGQTLLGLYDTSLFPGYDQEYRPCYTGVSQTLINKFKKWTKVTKGMYLTWDGLLVQSPFNGILVDAQHRSDAGNPTCSWNSGLDTRNACKIGGNTVSNYRYLISLNNAYNVSGTGPGFGQRSAHSWTKAGDKKASYADLLDKYYTGVWIQNEYYAIYSAKYYNSYNSSGCTGPVITTLTSRTINNHWPGVPVNGVNADGFCVTWETSITLDASDWYTFYVARDDGIRLKVDGTLILDRWSNSSPVVESVSIYLTGGTPHSIRFEFYDAGFDAVARLSINRGTGMVGRYYDYKVAKTGGVPADYKILRPDTPSKFDWVQSSPLDTNQTYDPTAERIDPDTFSVIWQGNIYVDGSHDVVFKGRYDDGLYAKFEDDPSVYQTVIDDYVLGSARTTQPAGFYRSAGLYKVEVRYFEDTYDAVATFDWWYDSSTNPNEESDEES